MRTDDVDRLIAVTAHELRTPLSTILGYQELLADGLVGSIDQSAREALSRIRSAALQLLAFTHGLEILTGALRKPELEAVNLASIFDEIGDRLAADTDARGVNLLIDTPPETAALAEADGIGHALELTIYALLKARAGTELRVVFGNDDDHLLVYFAGDTVTGLPPLALRPLEDESLDSGLDGVGLRFAIVRAGLERLGGSFEPAEEHGGALVMRLRRA